MPFFTWELHNILFYIITFLWIIEFIVFRSRFKESYYSDKQAFKKILVVIITLILGTISYNQFKLFILPQSTFVYFNYFGVTIYLIGIFLRYYANLTLGQYFIRDVEVSNNQKLISHGPYRILAHPLYLGLFLLVLSIPVYFGQVIWIMATLLFFGKVILASMKTEEKALEESLGETYTTWLKKRYRFIPWVF